MFEQTFVAGAAKTRRAWMVPVCFAGQLVAVGCMALMPLIFFEGLPQARLTPLPLAVPGLYHPPEHPSAVRVVAVKYERVDRALVAPNQTPMGIHLGPDRPAAAPPDFAEACPGVCVPGGLDAPEGVRMTRLIPQPTPVETPRVVPRRETPKPPTPAPIRVSSTLQEAKLIRRVIPVYPRSAIEFRISGAVHLAAVIGADGRIRDLQVVDGHPFLVRAAVDAVRQWVYQPTMLGGNAVEVMTEITVYFNMTRN